MPTLRKRAWFGLCLALVLAAARRRVGAGPDVDPARADDRAWTSPSRSTRASPSATCRTASATTSGRTPGPYQRAELRLVVNVGSVVEDQDQLGLAHFVEHMAFNGSEHFAKQDLIQFMESIGMRLGPGVNANTSFDETVYMLHVPTDNPEALRKAFLFFADVAHRPVVRSRGDRQGARRHHRGVAAGTRRRRRACRTSRCPSCSRARATPSASRSARRRTSSTFKPEVLKRFYTDWYRPDLMAVIAVGDFDKAPVEKMIKDAVRQHPGAGSAPAAARLRGAGSRRHALRHRHRPRGDDDDGRRLQHAAAARADRRSAPTGSSQVERLYTGMLNARLGELTLKPDPPFVRAGIERGIFVRTKEAATMMALVKEDGIARGLAALVTESARAARFGFTPGELERERRDVLRGYESAFAERDKEESADLAAEFIRAFTEQEPMPGMTYEYGLVQRFVPAITLDEVNKVAKEWASGSRVVLVNAPKKPGLALPGETPAGGGDEGAPRAATSSRTWTWPARSR